MFGENNYYIIYIEVNDMIGIYKITNKINGKCYIGQSKNIEERWRHHRTSKLKYPLYLAFQKYGLENFS